MSHTSIILLKGDTEVKVCYNIEDEPNKFIFKDAGPTWQSNHEYIKFYSVEERNKVLDYMSKRPSSEFFKLDLTQETIVDCVRIENSTVFNDGFYGGFCLNCKEEFTGAKRQYMCKDCCNLKYAFFEAPKELDLEKKIYSEEQMKQCFQYAYNNGYANSCMPYSEYKNKYLMNKDNK